MINKEYFFLLIFLALFISCNKNSNENIELTILNKNFQVYCFQGDCDFEVTHSTKNYELKSNNVVRLKIKNNSRFNYLLNTYCLNEYKKGCSHQGSFPDKNFGLDLNNLILTYNEVNRDTLKVSNTMGDKPIEVIKNINFNDSILFKKYHLLGYKKDSWNYINSNMTKNLIKIKSGETIYLETYISLPYNIGHSQFIQLLSNKKYTASLIFHSDTLNIKKYLTWAQLKNIEENRYKLFSGTISSTNSIPIKFIEE